MLIETLLKLEIDVGDYVTLFSSENGVLHLLKKSFEKKCFKRYYIVEIIRIVESGPAVLNYTHRLKPAKISSRVLARCITYSRGEIINGCEIIKADDAAILCKSSTEVIIANPRGVYGVKEGDLISIVVIKAEYPLNGDRITINGDAFSPLTKPVYYRLDGVPTEEVMKNYKAMITASAERFQAIPKEMETRVKAFEKLLGPKTKQTVSGKVLSLSEICSAEISGWVAVDPGLGIAELKCVLCDKPPENASVISINIDDAIGEIIKYKTGTLGMLSAYINIYDVEKFGSHKGLWLHYRSVLEKA